jgi:hypothetical protein
MGWDTYRQIAVGSDRLYFDFSHGRWVIETGDGADKVLVPFNSIWAQQSNELINHKFFNNNAMIWDFYRDTGNDSSPVGADLSENGNIAYSTLNTVRIASFNSANPDYMSLDNFGNAGENVRFTGAFSIGGWFRYHTLATTMNLISKDAPDYGSQKDSKYAYSLYINSDGSIRGRVRDEVQTSVTQVFCFEGFTTNTGLIQANEWFHIAYVYDPAGATLADRHKIYINGALAAGSTTSGGTFISMRDTVAKFTLGANFQPYGGTVSNKYNGDMWCVFAYGDKLSASEAQALYEFTARRIQQSDPLIEITQTSSRIVFIGDSIVNRYPNLAKNSMEYYLDQHFSDPVNALFRQDDLYMRQGLQLISKGIDGDKVAGVASRFKRDAVQYRPNTVIVLVGTNNVRDGDTFANVESSFNQIKAMCSDAGIALKVCEVMPRNGDTGIGQTLNHYDAAISAWNSALASWCSANSVGLISINYGMQDPSNRPRPNPAYFSDVPMRHPNLIGNQALARLIWEDYQHGR